MDAPLKVLLSQALARPKDEDMVPPGSNSVERKVRCHRFLLSHNACATAAVHYNHGRVDEARDAYREALIWFPKNVLALQRMAELLKFTGGCPSDLRSRLNRPSH